MTQIHAAKCPSLKTMREGLDMNSMNGLVTFFQRYAEDKNPGDGSAPGRTGQLDGED
jgi:hypothetical protein